MDFLVMNCGKTITGECTIKNYEGWIELLSFNHGISMAVTGDTSNKKRTAGKPNHEDFTVTKFMDLSTCKLLNRCNAGTAIPVVSIVVAQNEQDKVNPVLTFNLKDVVVSSISESGGGGSKPVETVTMNYTAIEWIYKAQEPSADTKGEDSAKWSLTQNAAA